jgi:hypothetical protein
MRTAFGASFDVMISYRFARGGYLPARDLARRLAGRGLRPFSDSWLPLPWSALEPHALEASRSSCVHATVLNEGALSQFAAGNNIDWLRAELASASGELLAIYPTAAAQATEHPFLRALVGERRRIEELVVDRDGSWADVCSSVASAAAQALAEREDVLGLHVAPEVASAAKGCLPALGEADRCTLLAGESSELRELFLRRSASVAWLRALRGPGTDPGFERVDAPHFVATLHLDRLRPQWFATAQGFIVYPIYHRSCPEGRLQEFIRLHSFHDAELAAHTKPELRVHSHQLPLRSWVLEGEVRDVAYEREELLSCEDGASAIFDVRWDGTERHTVRHHETTVHNLSLRGERPYVRARQRGAVERHGRGSTYAIAAGELHASSVPPAAFAPHTSTLVYMGHTEGRVHEHEVLGPPHLPSSTTLRRGALSDAWASAEMDGLLERCCAKEQVK